MSYFKDDYEQMGNGSDDNMSYWLLASNQSLGQQLKANVQ